MERSEIELGLQGKMIELGPHCQPLQFDKATQRGKEMIGLRGDGLRGGLGQRDVLFKRLMITLSGEGLARCLGWYPARFQPLPIGTAREVFPQAARPVGFTTRVMGQGDPGSDFHWYAAAPWSGLSFPSQNSPKTP